MSELAVSVGLYSLVALVLGIPTALFAAAVSKRGPKAQDDPPMTMPQAFQMTPHIERTPFQGRTHGHKERQGLGYAAPAARECGICHQPLSPYVLRTHDGLWRCAKHKNTPVG